MNIHKGRKKARNSKYMNTYKRLFFSFLNFLISLKSNLLLQTQTLIMIMELITYVEGKYMTTIAKKVVLNMPPQNVSLA